MSNKKALVIYYTRSGDTREIAEKIASKLDCDIEEIIDKTKRRGIFGYIKSGFHAFRGKLTRIETPEKDPAEYDIVIVGTPVWAGTMTPAIRTYLTGNGDRIQKTAFFCSLGGSGDEKTYRDLTELTGLVPVAKMSISNKDRKTGYEPKIDAFVDKIKNN